MFLYVLIIFTNHLSETAVLFAYLKLQFYLLVKGMHRIILCHSIR